MVYPLDPRPPLRIIVLMKAIATVLVLSASLLLQAQTPAPKSAPKSSPAKNSPAKPGASHAAPGPRPSLLNPASLTAKAPADFDRDLWFEGDALVRMKKLGSDHSTIVSDLVKSSNGT